MELDDIIKSVYEELDNYDLKKIIRPFCCRENKILVDYKKFRAHTTQQLKVFEETGKVENHKEKTNELKSDKLDLIIQRIKNRSKSAARSRANESETRELS